MALRRDHDERRGADVRRREVEGVHEVAHTGVQRRIAAVVDDDRAPAERRRHAGERVDRRRAADHDQVWRWQDRFHVYLQRALTLTGDRHRDDAVATVRLQLVRRAEEQ
jgi:hypothetical protein